MKNKTTIFRVFDDEWEEIMGEGQLKEFAEQRILEGGYFDEEDLTDIITTEDFGTKLAPKMIKTIKAVQENHEVVTDLETAKGILNANGYDIEEIEVY